MLNIKTSHQRQSNPSHRVAPIITEKLICVQAVYKAKIPHLELDLAKCLSFSIGSFFLLDEVVSFFVHCYFSIPPLCVCVAFLESGPGHFGSPPTSLVFPRSCFSHSSACPPTVSIQMPTNCVFFRKNNSVGVLFF